MVLEASGHEVRASDLYAMGFKPTIDQADFSTPANPDMLQIPRGQENAYWTVT